MPPDVCMTVTPVSGRAAFSLEDQLLLGSSQLSLKTMKEPANIFKHVLLLASGTTIILQ